MDTAALDRGPGPHEAAGARDRRDGAGAMGALAPLVRVALDQPESGPLGPRPVDLNSPLGERLTRCVKTDPFWASYGLSSRRVPWFCAWYRARPALNEEAVTNTLDHGSTSGKKNPPGACTRG